MTNKDFKMPKPFKAVRLMVREKTGAKCHDLCQSQYIVRIVILQRLENKVLVWFGKLTYLT